MDVPTRVSAYGLDLKTLGEWLGSSFLICCGCEVTEEHVFLHCCFLRFFEMRDGHKSLFDSETRDTPKGTSHFLFVFSGLIYSLKSHQSGKMNFFRPGH